jgi:SAM-dependent methyltransferase
VSQVERRSVVETLRPAQEAAFGSAEYVEQESFIRASEIRALAQQAAVGPGVSVLDLCCGVAGPGLFLTRELGCDYVGVDSSEDAVAVATERARALPCRFEIAQVPPLPPGTFDVVLLLETMLAFHDKKALVEAVARRLPVGGRFAFTLEEGVPLTEAERARMPAADTVRLIPLDELHTLLEQAGLAIRWEEDWTESHREVASALIDAYAAHSDSIASRIGRRAFEDLLAAHLLWSEWLATGRARKFALVAERSLEAEPCPYSSSRRGGERISTARTGSHPCSTSSSSS